MIIKRAAIVLNGFIHDFTTGYWVAALLALYFLHGFQGRLPALAAELGIVERFFFWNSAGAVVVILATGGMRGFNYVDNIYGPEVERTRRRMLVIKHIVLLALFAAGEYWAYCAAFH
jgi:uncharacterized membrane protein